MEKTCFYNVAIVGCGSMGVELIFDKTLPFLYTFAGAVFKNPQTNLVALIDTDEEKLRIITQRLKEEGYPTDFGCYTSLREAVDDSKKTNPIDIVCCAAGPQVNETVIRQAEGWGIRGIYCEKPLVLSLKSADELANIEAASSLKVQVNYLRNFDTFHIATLDYIRNGGIGELLTVRVLYKGGIIAVAPHAFALLHLLFGKPLEVCGYYSPLANTRCPEDPNVDGIARYFFAPQGREINVSVTATGRGNIENNTYLFEFEFTGTKGRISILENGFRVRYEKMELSRGFESIGEMMPYCTERIPFDLHADTPREFFLEGLRRLINAIENNTATNCSVAIARDAEEVAHAFAISAHEEKVVSLPIPDRTHAFKGMVAGVKHLRKEAGIQS